ncbi:MAG TPA: rhodanese-like domain-containing protein [Candidatus Binatia bacterium]|nr:rhodanese-like domain-containing protein [Candidatus Binatia bacterium]
MKTTFLLLLILITTTAVAQRKQSIPNPMMDYDAFLAGATNVGDLRQQRRITEDRFSQMAADPVTIILDARSNEKFQLLHVKNAKHLSLPDMTAGELAKIIPAKNTRVLIYCNNNFRNEPEAFPAKVAAAPLNIYTFNCLHSYGYTNVYELGPLIDIAATKLALEGTRLRKQ